MQPLPAVTVGRFREQPVSPALRDCFAAVWFHQMPPNGSSPIVVTPDGTIDLQWIDGSLRVAGPDKEPHIETLPDAAMVIGFRFRPAAAASWLRVPARDLVDKRIALEDLWGSRAKRLRDEIRQARADRDLVAALETALAQHVPRMRPDAPMRAAHAFIEAGPPPGASLVPWLARSLGMSERTLRRRFEECYGYGPKTLDRILRYQRFIKLSRTSRLATAAIAAEAGYSDQAHLVRESRRLSGFTPKDRRSAGHSAGS
jgi:AraC-like DNA-binding protein